MLEIEDLLTAINRAYEKIAAIQLVIAKKSRISGDITINNSNHMTCVELYAYVTALQEIPFNEDIANNKVITTLYNKIKLKTKDLKQWG